MAMQPSKLEMHPHLPFSGRRRERTALEAALAEACEGRGSVCLLSGGPGIGKTRLAGTLAQAAGGEGMVHVVWGRCWEGGGAPDFWPWRLVVRALAGLDPTAQAGAATHTPLRTLGAFVESLFDVPAHTPPSAVVAAERFQAFEAMEDLLRHASARRTRPVKARCCS